MHMRFLGCNVRKSGVHLQFEINTCIFVCLFRRKGVPLLYFVISALHFDFSADSCVAWFSKRVHFEDQWKLNSRKSWRSLGHYVISGPIVICIRYIVHCVLCFQFRILKKFKVTKHALFQWHHQLEGHFNLLSVMEINSKKVTGLVCH